MMYNINGFLAKWSIFVRCLISVWLVLTLPPLDPRSPLYMLYMFIAAIHCQKGIRGLREGEVSKTKLKDTSFIYLLSNVTTTNFVRMPFILEMKSTSILNILALLLFEN